MSRLSVPVPVKTCHTEMQLDKQSFLPSGQPAFAAKEPKLNPVDNLRPSKEL